MRHRSAVAALVAVVALLCPTAPTGAQTEAVTFHDLAATPGVPYGPFPETWAVVTQSNSFVYAMVPAGYNQKPHHHDQEQFTLGVGGSLDYLIGSSKHRLGSQVAGLPPSNVLHAMINEGSQAASMMEFQPVRRPEWLPPNPPVPPQPRSAQPMTVLPDQTVTMDFALSSDGWQTDSSGARVKVLSGKTIRASFWNLSAAKAVVDLSAKPSAHERFVFVMSGQIRAVIGSTSREIGPKMLMVLAPSATGVTLQSLGRAGSEIVVFEPIDAASR